MYCDNKNHLLDLYFLEGKEQDHPEIKEHLAGCESCRGYLGTVQRTMDLLSKLEDEEPDQNLFNSILADVSVSVPKPSPKKKSVELMPVLQIVFGEIFLFSLIYFIKLQLTLLPFWKTIEKSWIVQSIGSVGFSVLLVLAAGSFLTLSIAPVLLFESDKRKRFY